MRKLKGDRQPSKKNTSFLFIYIHRLFPPTSKCKKPPHLLVNNARECVLWLFFSRVVSAAECKGEETRFCTECRPQIVYYKTVISCFCTFSDGPKMGIPSIHEVLPPRSFCLNVWALDRRRVAEWKREPAFLLPRFGIRQQTILPSSKHAKRQSSKHIDRMRCLLPFVESDFEKSKKIKSLGVGRHEEEE